MLTLSKDHIKNEIADTQLIFYRGLNTYQHGSYLSKAEIKEQALADRKKRAGSEIFTLVRGDMFKGDHLVINKAGRQYIVTLHDPEKAVSQKIGKKHEQKKTITIDRQTGEVTMKFKLPGF